MCVRERGGVCVCVCRVKLLVIGGIKPSIDSVLSVAPCLIR